MIDNDTTIALPAPGRRDMRTRRNIALIATTLALACAPTAQAVVGGQETEASGYPWLVAVGTPLFLERPSGQFCGGALIAPDQVMTAAHCVQIAELLPQALTVTFDRTDLRTGDGTTVGVAGIRVHPDFREETVDGITVYHHDVAILTLDHAQSRPTVDIAAPHGDSATILGWGATSDSDTSNTRLRSTTVPLHPDTDCTVAYRATYDPSDMVCAGSPEADTADFDSGGPLLVDSRLVGLTSWGNGTARPGYPGVYTRLPAPF